jgi:glycosyltransferase involved in cell wall biosynthesis
MQIGSESFEEPLIGIGLPVFNGERFVGQAVRAILEQTYRNWELVISDNASSDGTETICRQLAASDERIRYYRNAQNIGAHPNFNRVFELSRGKYFKWSAFDDMLHADYLKECINALEANPDGVACQSLLDFIDGDGNRLGICSTDLEQAQSPTPHVRFAAATLKPHNCFYIMAVFRREALAGSILMPSFHGADRALLAQLTLRGRFVQVSRPLFLLRDHVDRYSRSKTKPKDRAAWQDARFKGGWTFPTWRMYGEYWKILLRSEVDVPNRLWGAFRLLQWWFVNWNAARAAVDLFAIFAPGAVGWAERFKQRFISPAPGIDRLRKSQHRS